jgi:hypothetical protein
MKIVQAIICSRVLGRGEVQMAKGNKGGYKEVIRKEGREK